MRRLGWTVPHATRLPSCKLIFSQRRKYGVLARQRTDLEGDAALVIDPFLRRSLLSVRFAGSYRLEYGLSGADDPQHDLDGRDWWGNRNPLGLCRLYENLLAAGRPGGASVIREYPSGKVRPGSLLSGRASCGAPA